MKQQQFGLAHASSIVKRITGLSLQALQQGAQTNADIQAGRYTLPRIDGTPVRAMQTIDRAELLRFIQEFKANNR